MNHLDDFPKRDKNRRIQELSESAFQSAISAGREFVIQSTDRQDYGTDYVIEACDGEAMTNVRVHVQLKGTSGERNVDDSVSLSIKRTTLNYLTMQPGSVFICYHIPTEQLLVRRVDDVVREYEHGSSSWIDQTTVTARLRDSFDQKFQRTWKDHVVATAKSARDYRLGFIAHPPETMASFLEEVPIDLPVPADRMQAAKGLARLYDRNQDRVISGAFDKFRAVLGSSSPEFLPAYMAEINLGINGQRCDRNRIEDGIREIYKFLDSKQFSSQSLLYSLGNAWLALCEYEKARDTYNSALLISGEYNNTNIEAQCCKNLGTVMEKLNKPDAAYELYSRSLELAPNLPEAHFALALWYIRGGVDFDRALIHLDSIIWTDNSAGRVPSVLGWRIEVFFKLGRAEDAFRDIRNLLSDGSKFDWIWPWCGKLVATYGPNSISSTRLAVQFWDEYLVKFPDDTFAERVRLLCIWYIHMNDGQTEINFDEFRQAVENLVEKGLPDPDFLWDRVGHWAQKEGRWEDAEIYYRKAFDMSPAEYGYCLGTTLNFLSLHDEALSILLEQANEHQPDAMSWFQVAIAREGVGDTQGCIAAYKRAINLDESYDLAWFNLGGIYWNSGNEIEAIRTWKEAIRRFPEHQLASKLRSEFSILGN
ncbi:MAG: DUF4365 domain-containing protein [Chromatiales bacterium]|nr:DUF4365 domain-containing protein [Chromatiales bacterium]